LANCPLAAVAAIFQNESMEPTGGD